MIAGLWSVGGFAVGAQGELKFEDVAGFAEAEADALDGADVAFFPLGDFERLIGSVGGGPLDVVALGFYGAGIDVEDLLVGDVDEEKALPEFDEEDAAFAGVVDVPGFGGFVVEANDGEGDGFPFGGFVGFGGLAW